MNDLRKLIMKKKRSRATINSAACFGLTTLLALSMSVGAVAAGVAQSEPYDLTLSALMNADNSVDLYVGVSVKDDYSTTNSVPTFSNHIQLKSYDLTGYLRWTQNYQDQILTATPPSATATAMFTYFDMVYRQPVKAKVAVQNVEKSNTELLRNITEVLWRPDLAVSTVLAPEENTVDEPFDVVATINELNKDLGATADVVLYNDGVELMRMPAASVVTEGPTVVKFEGVSLAETGVHTLTVAIENVTPGDFDASNNSLDINVTIVDGAVSTTAIFQYTHSSRHVQQEWDNAFSKATSDLTYVRWDYTKIRSDINGVLGTDGVGELNFPLDVSYRVEVDGSVFATDELLGLIKNYGASSWGEGNYTIVAPGQSVSVEDHDENVRSNWDRASFENNAAIEYYRVYAADKDGDGIMEIITDIERKALNRGRPLAEDSLPTSISAQISVTSAGITYRASASASGAELTDSTPGIEYSYETGVRGDNYYRITRDERNIYLYKIVTPTN